MAFLLPITIRALASLPLSRGGTQGPQFLASFSQAPLSVSLFGAVLYLFLFQPWGFPLPITGKGTTSGDLLFCRQKEQERAKCAQGRRRPLPWTQHVCPNP